MNGVSKSVVSGIDVFRGIFRAATGKSPFQSSSRTELEGEQMIKMVNSEGG